ncbi:MAG TPA: dephospho-CoA kinase [Polyangia bacterium]|nr:dephospho-CoA kinase [Polyangia bacterium]
MARPRVIGLTGGIGSGKSTVAAMLAQLGAEVIDADQVAREVVKPGLPVFEDIVREFGREVLQPDGTLDRKRLGARVFADPGARRRLEAITHPRIAAETVRRVTEAGVRGIEIVIYEATLLVENQIHETLDGLIVVTAAPSEQIARVAARDGLSRAEVEQRMAAQLPMEKKLAVANWVIHNDGALADTRRQVEALWRTLRRQA